jgi:H+/Cl- antiporter ClcA
VKFSNNPDQSTSLTDLPASMIIGIIAGLLGAGFIFVNQKVNDFRKKILKSKWLKVLECCLLVVFTVTCFYFTPAIFSNGNCVTIDANATASENVEYR